MEKEGVKLQAAQLAFYQGQGQQRQAQGGPQNGGQRGKGRGRGRGGRGRGRGGRGDSADGWSGQQQPHGRNFACYNCVKDSEADEAVKVLEQLTQHPPEDIGVVIKGVEIQHQSRSRYPAPVPAPDHQTRHGGENRSSPGATRPQGSTTIDLWVWGSLV
ncbi:U3 small nucleolar RNA-associated protein 25-like isoform X1 [Coregonus clupeaformis]|uniref:U3 small nucleolar RNA-associated protein 25-like isoform X1 n=1 Tax=Coregonus clupeaformis TaxID=59861 RepID=UPI001E1C5ECE|nr:U3 small nucleolar RNA-associated protein 25-like isoform X1 [Coregonus clupeaformis]